MESTSPHTVILKTSEPFGTEARAMHVEAEWEKTKTAYRAAGVPFGWGRGLNIWIEHGQLTTAN